MGVGGGEEGGAREGASRSREGMNEWIALPALGGRVAGCLPTYLHGMPSPLSA